MSKSSSLKKVLILVSVLIVPGFLYYLLTEKGKNRYHPLPIFGPKEVASTSHTKRGRTVPDTIYHTVKSFTLTNQAGNPVKFPVDTNKINVVNFFYTRCPSFCNNMNAEMAKVVKVYKDNPRLRFFSITVDPDYDTPSVLAGYAKKFNAKPGKWDFLTGNEQEILQLAQKEFLVNAVADSANAGLRIHSPLLILVDPHQRIRGFYDSNNKEEVDKLIDEIKLQIAEELRKVISQ